MGVKSELFKKGVIDSLSVEIYNIDENMITDTLATKALGEIAAVVKDDKLNDFEMAEAVVEILNRYDINTGKRHDFYLSDDD